MAGIYKAYDIRGIVPDELTEADAYRIGAAYAVALGLEGKSVLVGHDMRDSSVPFAEQLIEGLRDYGANVTFAGMTSTPLFYYATREHDAGVIVTASHNPKEYNGFKFCREQAIPVGYGTGIERVEALVDNLPGKSATRGTLAEKEYLRDFLEFNLRFLKTTKEYTIVVDAANGMGGYTYGALQPRLEERGITVVPLYFEPDGSFPNHEANPLKEETLAALKERIAQEEATLGLAIDGDGDRCVFLDETGETIGADLFLAVIAQAALKEHPGATVMHDLRASRSVREAIKAAGGTPLMCRVGHAFIKAQMREEGALLAGELSGHFYPQESNYTENTMYALFHALNLLEETGKPLSELVAPLKKYAFSGEINSRVDDADAALQRVEGQYATGDADVSTLDGIRIEFPTWWLSVRKSNTEPVVRCIVEADTEEEMVRRRDEVLALIRQ